MKAWSSGRRLAARDRFKQDGNTIGSNKNFVLASGGVRAKWAVLFGEAGKPAFLICLGLCNCSDAKHLTL